VVDLIADPVYYLNMMQTTKYGMTESQLNTLPAFKYLIRITNLRTAQVIYMRFFHDMLLREISAEISVSVNTARMIEAKGLRVLRKFYHINRMRTFLEAF
jgi:DNA-directed RNA polymerase sigma subunit (sigma70/sigma32)